jgi:hypothetical protein
MAAADSTGNVFMALLTRIYFNAVFGALGGLLGWLLWGVFGEKTSSDDAMTWQLLIGGGIIGGAIGYWVVSVEAIRDRSLIRFVRLACYGVVLGMVGGAVGMYLGERLNFKIVGLIKEGDRATAGNFLGCMFSFGLGMMLLGLGVGMSEGIAARSLGKFSYGTLGGAIGGFVGGAFYGLTYLLKINKQNDALSAGLAAPDAALSGAVGLVILGACIGSLSALVQGVLLPASVKVMRGWQEGREYPLDKPKVELGRDEHVDIALFRDMKVEKHHALICRVGEGYALVNNGAPPELTRVNDMPVPQSVALQDGDRIQLGNVLLRFQMRAAQNRARRRAAAGRV